VEIDIVMVLYPYHFGARAAAQDALASAPTSAIPQCRLGPTSTSLEANAMARTPEEIFQHHAEVLVAGDLEGIVSDYSDDAIFITPSGVQLGKDGVRQGFVKLLGELPNANWQVPTQLFEDDILLIEWNAESEHTKADDGIDTFVFRDGLIRVQTVRYTLVRKD
jgi:hypothetical protein